MIKVHKHPIQCACADCETLFPADRFEMTWKVPRPADTPCIEATGAVPIGAPGPGAMRVALWVALSSDDPNHGHLVVDWPGFPGTIGASVTLHPAPPRAPTGTPRTIKATDDPILRGLSDAIPLRRKALEVWSARAMVELGYAALGHADHIPCDHHGFGAPALACPHMGVADGQAPVRETVLIYGVDGDSPDLFCTECFAAYTGGDLERAVTVCSRCLRLSLMHHHLVATTYYGAPGPTEQAEPTEDTG